MWMVTTLCKGDYGRKQLVKILGIYVSYLLLCNATIDLALTTTWVCQAVPMEQ